MKRAFYAFAGIALVGMTAYGIYVAGLFLELEYPYWPTIRAARLAHARSGVPVEAIVRQRFGAEASRIHWHACSYCADFGRLPKPYAHVQFAVPGKPGELLHFVLDRASGTLAPMTARTAEALPELFPAAELVPLEGGLGNGEEFVMPRDWAAGCGLLHSAENRHSACGGS